MTLRRRSKVLLGVLGLLVCAIVIARLVAPVYILGYVNKTLQGLDGYTGRVNDIELSLWRGAYVIKGVRIDKTTAKQPVPFVSVERTDISVHWGALLDGAIVAEIELLAPKLNIVAARAEKEPPAEKQAENREKEKLAKGEETSWQTQIKQLVPLDINRIGIVGGEVHFRDPYADPKVDVPIERIHGELTNLTNSEALSKDLVARASFRAHAMRSGAVSLDGKLDPYAKKPTFSLEAKLEELKMTELNDFLKAYVGVDAEKGTLSVYTSISCTQGRFKGYVKPLMRDLEILRWRDEEEGFFGKLWEGIVGAGKGILENDDKKQVATRIPLAGRIDKPDIDIFRTVMVLLRNAFIEALQRGLEPALSDAKVANKND